MAQQAISDHFYVHDSKNGMGTVLSHSSKSLRKLASPDTYEARNLSLQNSISYTDSITSESTARSDMAPKKEMKPFHDINCGTSQPKCSLSSNENLFRGSTPQAEFGDFQYFRPLSRVGPMISNDYIPKTFSRIARNPIIAFEQEEKMRNVSKSDKYEITNEDEDEEYDTDSSANENPTGEWTSPVVKEALARQVSKELQFRALWVNIARLFGANLILLVTEKTFQLYKLKSKGLNEVFKNNGWERILLSELSLYGERSVTRACVFARHLLWIIVAIILIDAVKFAWPQDQCRDLPLTGRQRELIGLKPLERIEPEYSADPANLIFSQRLFERKSAKPLQIPRYPRVNSLSECIRKKENKATEMDNSIKLRGKWLRS